MVKGAVSDEPGDVYSQECGFSHEGIVIKRRVWCTDIHCKVAGICDALLRFWFRPCIIAAVCNAVNISCITDAAKAKGSWSMAKSGRYTSCTG